MRFRRGHRRLKFAWDCASMRVLPKSFSRTAWVVVTNGLLLYGLLTGSASNSVAAVAISAALSAGILPELAGSAAAALLNVVPFLCVPVNWVWVVWSDGESQARLCPQSLQTQLSKSSDAWRSDPA
jgi:hypothetical protein